MARAAASAQTVDTAPHASARIIGVFDAWSGSPLEGVQIRDGFSGAYVLTTATGTARLDFVSYRGAAALVELRKIGYQPKQIVVSRVDTMPITETLERLTVLPTVTITTRYRLERDPGRRDGFEERCRAGSSTCIREAELESRPAANLADLLIHAPGVLLGACGASGRNSQCGRIAMKPTVSPPAYCQPTIFVDGFEQNVTMGAPIDLEPGRPATGTYTPTNVKAVEIYPSERNRPLRFMGDPTCGAIVIWTK